MHLGTIEDLVRFLNDFRSWGNQSERYDSVGMIHLLGACLDNLRRYATPSDLGDIPECLEAHQIIFLKNLGARL